MAMEGTKEADAGLFAEVPAETRTPSDPPIAAPMGRGVGAVDCAAEVRTTPNPREVTKAAVKMRLLRELHVEFEIIVVYSCRW
jgi:hypothetical protein